MQKTVLSALMLSLLVAACATNHSERNTSSSASSDARAESSVQDTPKRQGKHRAERADVVKVMSKDGDFEGEIMNGPVQSGTKFAKLKIGMSQRQVEDLIGPPTDVKGYQTGKAWIPVGGMFSQDAYRIEVFYKGEGRLVYSKNATKLFRIHVDRTEDGYQ